MSDRTDQLFHCKQCSVAFKFKQASKNLFCSLQCFADYQWYTVSVPKIVAGQGGNVKRYLVETYGNVCSECGQLPTWNSKPLVLQLDHIDGDSDNNHLSNLRLLCPNCHTQTETFGNAGKGNRYKKASKRNKYLQEYKKGP